MLVCDTLRVKEAYMDAHARNGFRVFTARSIQISLNNISNRKLHRWIKGTWWLQRVPVMKMFGRTRGFSRRAQPTLMSVQLYVISH